MFLPKLLAATALAATCVPAIAGTMTVIGTDSLADPVVLGGTHWTGAVWAGFIDGQESTLGDIRTVCANLDHGVAPGQSWPDTLWDSSTYSDPAIQLAGNMVAADFNGVTTADQAAGLQLDVWEILYDGAAPSAPDFTSGNFTASGLTAGALAAADTYWNDRFTKGSAIFIRAEDGKGQDQLTPSPEPASLIALSAGALALLRRSRRGLVR